jgi:hypothetical protein
MQLYSQALKEGYQLDLTEDAAAKVPPEAESLLSG